MQIGKNIRKYRKENGLTQEEMAARLGVTAPAVNKWENIMRQLVNWIWQPQKKTLI